MLGEQFRGAPEHGDVSSVSGRAAPAPLARRSATRCTAIRTLALSPRRDQCRAAAPGGYRPPPRPPPRRRGPPPRRSSAAPAPGRGLAASHSMSSSTVRREPVGHQAEQLVAQHARRERGEDRPQRADGGVLALGRCEVAGRERALDAEAHERHGAVDALAHASAPLLGERSAGSRPAGSDTTRSSSCARRDLRGAQHRLLSRAVGVERQQHDCASRAQLADLVLGQRRAHDPDGVAQPGLVQREHVRVALAQRHAAGLRGRSPARGRSRRAGGPCGRSRPSVVLTYFGCWSAPIARAPKPSTRPRASHEREHDPRGGSSRRSARLLLRRARARRRRARASLKPARARGDQHCVPRARRVADAELAQRRLLEPAARAGTRARPSPRRTPTAGARRRPRCARAARAAGRGALRFSASRGSSSSSSSWTP